MCNATKQARAMVKAIATGMVLMTATVQAEPVRGWQLSDNAAQHRFEFVVGRERASTSNGELVSFARVASAVEHDAMLNGFSVSVVDENGRTVTHPDRWEVTVMIAARCHGVFAPARVVAQLSSTSAEISVPRPYGYSLRESDSLVVFVRYLDLPSARTPERLRVSVDYEAPAATSIKRIAALTMAREDQPSVDEGTTARTWELTADSTGSIQAIAGTPLKTARNVVLRDMATGEIIWHARGGSYGSASVFGEPSGIVRPGVSVNEGGRYRLTAEYDGAAATGTVTAVLVPNRTMP